MALAPTLPAIAALARAGATGRAWAQFVAGGWDARRDDPAALSLHGRLCKDRARLAQGAAREGLFAEAADCYARANALAPAPYRAINAATARLLAGDTAGAADGARQVLAMLDGVPPPADTPYYLAATRAEAALLLGDPAAAEAAMTAAAAADPDGWDDRAVTLAQLREIGACQGADLAWLDAFAPPLSLHFAGHMGVAAGGESEAALHNALDELLARQPIGFAWGALAAGADIVIAERLLAQGTALHVVLPCPVSDFIAQSVAPAGHAWVERCTAVLDAAASLRMAGDCATGVHDPLATAHAGALAIGSARLNAQRLGSKALQLIVLDEAGGGRNTARQAEMWLDTAGPQAILTIPRDAAVEQLFAPETPDPARQLAVQLTVLADWPDPRGGSAALQSALAPVAAALAAAGLAPGAVRARQGRWDVLCTDPHQALDLAARLAALPVAPAVGVHTAIGLVLPDPAGGGLVAYGPETGLAARLAALAPAGTTLVSDALAVSLAASGNAQPRTQLYHFGDPDSGGAVHILLS